MHYQLADVDLMKKTAVLSDEHVSWLAQTYDNVHYPVWVNDLSANCVYRNGPARSASWNSGTLIKFELLDHQNQTIGHFTTVKR